MAKGLNVGLGISFQPGLQEGLINNRGADMIHEVGFSCTCRVDDVYVSTREDSAEHRREPFCTRCGQDGWLFRDPVLVRGLITNIRFQRNIMDAGNYLPGDSLFSPDFTDTGCGDDEGRRIGTADKLTATWPEPLDDGHVLVRGSGSKSAALGIKTELDDDEDRLWYEPANALWCEDEFGVKYNEGSDFKLGPGKIIKWIGNKPNVGVRFTIKYNAYFEWIV